MIKWWSNTEALRSSARVSSQNLLDQMIIILSSQVQSHVTPVWNTVPALSLSASNFFLQGEFLNVHIKAYNISGSRDAVLHGHGSQLHTLDGQIFCVTVPFLRCSHYASSLSMSYSGGSCSLCWQTTSLSLFKSHTHLFYFFFFFFFSGDHKPPQ